MKSRMRRARPRAERGPVLLVGGAGFVGTNLAHRLAQAGEDVLIFDKLSRPGVERNLQWLLAEHKNRVRALIADVREEEVVAKAVSQASSVFHLAAQVAVTHSLADPLNDFEVNARGTLNILEAIRRSGRRIPLVLTSTNKVYGPLADLQMKEEATRYEPTDDILAHGGINESRPLDFHSPYGCSKGAADQYTLDYARSYGLPFVVLRMSCIYGPHQHGNEDQGWLAHFLREVLAGRKIKLYGSGKQVRDVLFVSDLVDALLLALESAEELAGSAFNLGGGVDRAVSLLEVLSLIEELTGCSVITEQGEWRQGDQRYFVADHRAFSARTGWLPRVSVEEGMGLLLNWLNSGTLPQEGRSAVSQGPLKSSPQKQ